jgi:hypothetical protein
MGGQKKSRLIKKSLFSTVRFYPCNASRACTHDRPGSCIAFSNALRNETPLKTYGFFNRPKKFNEFVQKKSPRISAKGSLLKNK